MGNVLKKICDSKLLHIAKSKKMRSQQDLELLAKQAPPLRNFYSALDAAVEDVQMGIALIAELKKASPSKGLIRPHFDPTMLAHAYENGGATCLSVLTDSKFFMGADRYLMQVKRATSLPVLRKDFILDPYQIAETRMLGGDCILLIMAALSVKQAKELKGEAATWGLAVLVEVHNEQELENAIEIGAELIGINNRNLKTLEVDLNNTKRLLPRVPQSSNVVCESGINNHQDILNMKREGVYRFLVGESLMRQDNISVATHELLHG